MAERINGPCAERVGGDQGSPGAGALVSMAQRAKPMPMTGNAARSRASLPQRLATEAVAAQGPAADVVPVMLPDGNVDSKMPRGGPRRPVSGKKQPPAV